MSDFWERAEAIFLGAMVEESGILADLEDAHTPAEKGRVMLEWAKAAQQGLKEMAKEAGGA